MFDDATIDIPCSNCDHQVPKTIAWLKTNSELLCPGCGSHIVLENVEELIGALDEADGAVAQLKRRFDALGKEP